MVPPVAATDAQNFEEDYFPISGWRCKGQRVVRRQGGRPLLFHSLTEHGSHSQSQTLAGTFALRDRGSQQTTQW